MADKLNTRNKKLDFLKGIETGTRSIAEIRNPGIEIWENSEDDNEVMVEGITGRTLLKKDFKPNSAGIMILWADTG